MNQTNQPASKEAEKRGLECPRCGCKHFHVIYTRPTDHGRIRRRRECRHCGRRITTYESSLG
jgi:transcriptional regulator NrdR family protein